jgi:glycolate oxidase FAD binding subunit
LIRLGGFEPSVLARAAALERLLNDSSFAMSRLEMPESLRIWREIANVDFFAHPSDAPVWRIGVRSSHAAAVAAYVAEAMEALYYYDCAGGVIWLQSHSEQDAGATIVRTAIARAGGGDAHATLVRADAAIRSTIAPFEPLVPGVEALTRRIKRQFDPHALFNRGRMYEGI